MSKEAALRKHYDERGLTTQTAHFDKQLREARAQDQASYGTVRPAPRDPEFRAQLDKCGSIVCCGCCDDPNDTNPEHGGSWCTIL